MTDAWTREQFEAQLRERGKAYHIHHPFNVMLNGGRATPEQIRGWVANRFYYQVNIPRKDAAVMSNCDDRAERRRWILRMLDHDGHGSHVGDDAGGIESWSRLAQAVGLDPLDLWSHRHVQPGVRFAVDAYVNFARQRPWEEAAISSLTEMFAPRIHADRLAGWPTLYPWIDVEGLAYFRSRIPLATRDVEHGLEVARRWCTTRARQERAIAILHFKLDILWSMLDAIERGFPDDMPLAQRP